MTNVLTECRKVVKACRSQKQEDDHQVFWNCPLWKKRKQHVVKIVMFIIFFVFFCNTWDPQINVHSEKRIHINLCEKFLIKQHSQKPLLSLPFIVLEVEMWTKEN